ncbi:MAG TPA: hypothetical protein ENF41_04475 [Candidatus Bathyarchaeota archaeon]|nr:hypothetical protein [Candidatus Bathyarchaeota archaeon]
MRLQINNFKKWFPCLLLLLLLIPTLDVSGQPMYWVALNYDVEIDGSGTAYIIVKLHPIDSYGKSLLANEEILQNLMEEEESVAEEAVLLFTESPYLTEYKVIEHAHLDESKLVYCDVLNTGRMQEYKGAVVLTIELHLNSTTAIEHIADNIYQVIIADFYTIQDPRSWIDVLNITIIEDAQLINFSYLPSHANPPQREGNNLLWVNRNEPEAPDFYLLTLKLPRIVFSKRESKISVEISSISSEDHYLYIEVKNTSEESGYVDITLLGDNSEQTRRVFLTPLESVTLSFPYRGETEVRVTADGKLLAEKSLPQSASPELSNTYIKYFAIVLSVVGFIVVIVGIYFGKEEKSEESPPLPPPSSS